MMSGQGKLGTRSSLLSRLTAGIVVLLLFSSFAIGQKRASDPFATVPVSARSRLVARLKLLIKYQRELQWDKEFDLLSNLFVQGENENKKKFVGTRKRYYRKRFISRLMDFNPRATTGPPALLDGGEWEIHGWGGWRVKGRRVSYDTSVIAVRQRGDWFFSEVSIVTSVGGPPEPCPY